MSLRETGVVATSGQARDLELFQLRDDHGFTPDIPSSAARSRRCPQGQVSWRWSSVEPVARCAAPPSGRRTAIVSST